MNPARGASRAQRNPLDVELHVFGTID